MKLTFHFASRRPTLVQGSIGQLRLLPILAGIFVCGSAPAFPPAPPHTLYGLVRNQWGDPLNMAGAEILLETPTGPGVSTFLVPNLEPGVNYRLLVPMDAGISPDLYKPTALKPLLPFRLRVKIGQTSYLPMEMAGNYSQIGQPSRSTRLDLTLGIDSDGDGIPDTWEQALMAVLGGSLTLADIRPGDDADGDGISNLNEYLAGTYAFDPEDGFLLKIAGFQNQSVALEFFAIRGRTYTLYRTESYQQWSKTPFRIAGSAPEAPLLQTYYATDARLLRIEVPAPAPSPTNQFFKLLVQ